MHDFVSSTEKFAWISIRTGAKLIASVWLFKRLQDQGDQESATSVPKRKVSWIFVVSRRSPEFEGIFVPNS